jgi:hypothetical protein
MNRPSYDPEAHGDPSDVMACPVPTRVLPLASLTPDLQTMVDNGVDPIWVQTLGHAPEVLIAWTKYYWPLLFGGAVDIRIKEAARLRIARLNACHY